MTLRKWFMGLMAVMLVVSTLRAGDGEGRTALPDFVVTAQDIGGAFITCPEPDTLVRTGLSDLKDLQGTLPQIIGTLYQGPDSQPYDLRSVKMATDAGLSGEMVVNWCGQDVADSTWVVSLYFPKLAPSNSAGAGQFFVAKTKQGWNVWLRYH